MSKEHVSEVNAAKTLFQASWKPLKGVGDAQEFTYPADVRRAEHDVAAAVDAEQVADREVEPDGVAAG